jgi:GNAT superfamily N-acetyltransferase
MAVSGETRSRMAVHPVDQDRWPALERLFASHGNPAYCWCARWRVPSAAFLPLKAGGRKAILCESVRAGVPIGVLGYVQDEPVGWCSIAPRETYAALERSRTLKRVDDVPVWSIACFFLAPAIRGQGYAIELLQAALSYARSCGAPAVEAYPVAPSATTYRWMGTTLLFARAGFAAVGQAGGGRCVMRYVFS